MERVQAKMNFTSSILLDLSTTSHWKP